ncbi:unnamed protein product [Brassica oleracea var. botrytis]|uniref:DUF4283 domain-containing protein n=1 Tax=Brassica oleracea TaxID=3712 RepID=A0A3P6DJX3_BRAOL|nr:unnamed protein product [Brassica oleracea]
MTQRLSRSEKGKWVPDPNKQPRRPPILIPEPENNSLVEANKFTLIGRVTNPHIRKPRALVDFFLQHWSVAGQYTGRDLGPYLFQFTFESEHDMQTILNKAPFHFKRWMLILQRWEPIVSDDFPATISFWIRVHGIPLHYWTEQALHTIGSELGVVETKDVQQGRVRVHVNGLKPLEMLLDITLAAGGTKQVEIEYEKLEKHCFLCKSLSHEQDDCPQKRNFGGPNTEKKDINYSKTMESLDSYRRAKDDRKEERNRSSYYQNRVMDSRPYYRSREDLYATPRGSRQRTPPRLHSNRDYYNKDASSALLVDRDRATPPHYRRARELEIRRSLRISQGQASVHSRLGDKVWVEKASQSRASHTPPPRPPREPMIGSQEVNSSVEQRPVTERLSLTVARNILPDGDDLTHMWNQYLMIESLPCKDSHLQQTKESRYYSTVQPILTRADSKRLMCNTWKTPSLSIF